ncbi:hypothetical protein AVEN_60526-1 [Araneus ventricosus]|uniref:Uncharacterized protein n=1 Tax=Araneus ventricosus TaxID=182803 RepID=A0A4Y2FVP4_ARAVE|nr:hypothetical protein AVEN_60526-1 [Araneus ventricosus]
MDGSAVLLKSVNRLSVMLGPQTFPCKPPKNSRWRKVRSHFEPSGCRKPVECAYCLWFRRATHNDVGFAMCFTLCFSLLSSKREERSDLFSFHLIVVRIGGRPSFLSSLPR